MTLPESFKIMDVVDCEHAEFERCEVDESESNIEAWLGAAPKDGSKLTVFAQDGTGSLYCLFQRAGAGALEEAPVIYLGSEGEVTPVAKTPADFLDFVGAQLSLSAYDDEAELFDDAESEDDEDMKSELLEQRAAVREAFEKHLGRALRDPKEIVAEARTALPDLRAWVDENNAHQ
jgi:hypothetical protein